MARRLYQLLVMTLTFLAFFFLMQSTDDDPTLIDIGETVYANMNIIPSIMVAHALSGCDTVAPYHGIGKLGKLRNISGTIEHAIEQATLFISNCYGFKSTSMTDCRIQSWIQKTSKARKKAPPWKALPSMHKAFIENVKWAHFQAIIWYSTMEASPPDIDPTAYGWQRDMENRILSPDGLPDTRTTRIPGLETPVSRKIQIGPMD